METDKLNRVTAQEMREQLSDLLNRAAYTNETTLITRQGKEVAVLVSVKDWAELVKLRKDNLISEGISAQSENSNGDAAETD